ncbi:MAG: nuclear transport factor 2 family protein [Betaproteobacteria bacterium]|nr:nuclear transport factor 2 family protein [Betaproteobacteria bacterium]
MRVPSIWWVPLLVFFSMVSLAAPAPVSFGEASKATKRAAEPYLSAYIARDWDRLEKWMGEEASFSDPTATLVFGPVKSTGRESTLKYFRENYGAISHMQFNQQRAVFSGQHALFEGTLDFTLDMKSEKPIVTRGMPFVVVLKVVGERVIEHTDYADYHVFNEARKQRAQAKQ